ncbi:unnamed protein product [Laminaria digitata]
MPAQAPQEHAKAVSVLVKGRVQGVGFRAFTRRNAMLLGLKGEVSNLPDGAVKAHLEGSSERVKQMLHLIKKGPSLARVDQIVVSPVNAMGRYKTFEIGLARR